MLLGFRAAARQFQQTLLAQRVRLGGADPGSLQLLAEPVAGGSPKFAGRCRASSQHRAEGAPGSRQEACGNGTEFFFLFLRGARYLASYGDGRGCSGFWECGNRGSSRSFWTRRLVRRLGWRRPSLQRAGRNRNVGVQPRRQFRRPAQDVLRIANLQLNLQIGKRGGGFFGTEHFNLITLLLKLLRKGDCLLRIAAENACEGHK